MATLVAVLALSCVTTQPQLPSAQLDSIRSAVDAGAVLLDVRTPFEHHLGHIPGSINIPLYELDNRWPEIPRDQQPVVVYCRSGGRSAAAVEVLRRHGVEPVLDLGPMDNWRLVAVAPN